MIERPDITDAELVRWMGSAWDLDVRELRFLPVGLDGWAYVVNERFFLKVKRSAPDAVALPAYLRSQGMSSVVAPIATASGRYFLLLYPYIDGDNLWDTGLTDAQWYEYGQILGALHRVPLPADIALPVESFTTTVPARIRAMPAGVWESYGDLVLRLADDVDRLAASASGGAYVICHTDIHPGNLLADPAGRLHVVDWDAPMLAPRERDLMFVLHHAFGAHPLDAGRETRFRAGYGPVDVDPARLAYYKAERALDDIVQFTASILDGSLSEVTRREESRYLRRCLEDLAAHPKAYAG